MLGISGEGKPNGVNPALSSPSCGFVANKVGLTARDTGQCARTSTCTSIFPLPRFHGGLYHATAHCRTGTRYQRGVPLDGHRRGEGGELWGWKAPSLP